MRLPANARFRALALGLTVLLLGGCNIVGMRGSSVKSTLAPTAPAAGTNGPAADYPMVLGDPYKVDGRLYTPSDTMNYDVVGYAAADPQAGQGVTASHKTLPLPSYVEVTDLDNGHTILVRVERRGPMTTSREIALSPAALAELGANDGSPVRVRRVNPPEEERAALRAGKAAPARMDTPKSLLAVLMRKLPTDGSASLRSAATDAARKQAEATGVAPPLPKQAAVGPLRPAAAPAAQPAAAGASFAQAFAPPKAKSQTPARTAAPVTAPTAAPGASTAYPLAPLDSVPRRIASRPRPVVVASRGEPVASETPAKAATRPAEVADSAFVVQAAAFSSKANAERAAKTLGGHVKQAGSYYRVRTGPYATRGQAEAALAKVRAAGYSDARVSTSG